MPDGPPDQWVSFGSYTFRASTGELRRGRREIRLTPRSAAVLSALIARPGELITKDGLSEAVWAGVAVSDAALTSCIQEIRDALGDDARRPRYIETVHRRGYRFVAPVPCPRGRPGGAPPARPGSASLRSAPPGLAGVFCLFLDICLSSGPRPV